MVSPDSAEALLDVTWRSEILPRPYRSPLVELHLVPADPADYEELQLERVRGELAGLGRSGQLFTDAQSLQSGSSAAGAWTFSPGDGCGLAVLREGQRTCWFALPEAEAGLKQHVATRLDLLLRIDLPLPARLAPGIGLDPITATSKNAAGVSLDIPARVRIGPETAFSAEDLREAAGKIAEELVARLAAPFTR